MFIAKQVNYEFDAEGIALRKLGKTLNLMTLGEGMSFLLKLIAACY